MKWYEKETSGFPGVIMSSRVRLARNLKAYVFPNHMESNQARQLIDDVFLLYANKDQDGMIKTYMDDLPAIEKVAMMERHLVSPLFISEGLPKGLIATEDEQLSLMVNEEDHLRIQAMTQGADLATAYRLANEMDDYIESQIDYAFHDSYGYLTACPTNVGTGLRASYMLHVPALEATGQLRIILEAIGKFGITVRGIYGESSEAIGSVFQVSNQVTLGFSEKEIMDNLNSVTMQIVDQEMAVREKLLTERRIDFEDSIYRSYGILSQARIVSSKEAMTLLSDIKLGMELGILKTSQSGQLNIFQLMTSIQPANLQKLEKKSLGLKERDIVRANLIREYLPDIQGG